MNGFVYLILCLSGLIPVIPSVLPDVATIGPVIFISGLMVCEEYVQDILLLAIISRFSLAFSLESVATSTLRFRRDEQRQCAHGHALGRHLCLHHGPQLDQAGGFAAIGIIHQLQPGRTL
jgi:hypothetical protein